MTAIAYRANDSRVYGYTYDSQIYCPTCLIETLIVRGHLAPAARDMAEETALDQLAGTWAIDRDDERKFDSADFPKDIDDRHEITCADQCGECSEYLGMDDGEEPAHVDGICSHNDD
jgi:hypothetical protein